MFNLFNKQTPVLDTLFIATDANLVDANFHRCRIIEASPYSREPSRHTHLVFLLRAQINVTSPSSEVRQCIVLFFLLLSIFGLAGLIVSPEYSLWCCDTSVDTHVRVTSDRT